MCTASLFPRLSACRGVLAEWALNKLFIATTTTIIISTITFTTITTTIISIITIIITTMTTIMIAMGGVNVLRKCEEKQDGHGSLIFNLPQ